MATDEEQEKLKERLRPIIENSDTAAGRSLDIFIQCLIILSLVSFSVGTLPDLSDTARRWLRIFEIVTVSIFTVEYLLRIYVAEKPLKYMTSFFGIIDLLAILPFYISLAVDLRAVRSFRLLRLFRIFKVARYNSAMRRFHTALIIAREELVIFLVLTGIILFIAATGVYYFENKAQPEAFASIFHSLWWAVATLTTVGYGDVYPITVGGRVFTFLVLLAGLGVVAVPAGIVASALNKARELEKQKRESSHNLASREG